MIMDPSYIPYCASYGDNSNVIASDIEHCLNMYV